MGYSLVIKGRPGPLVVRYNVNKKVDIVKLQYIFQGNL